MSEKEARTILQSYQEEDGETGESYHLEVKECISTIGEQYVFLCSVEGQEAEYAVMKETGDVLVVPT